MTGCPNFVSEKENAVWIEGVGKEERPAEKGSEGLGHVFK